MGQGISLKSERNNPWFKPWFNILLHTQISCVCHSIRSMFRVLGIYNFDSFVKKVHNCAPIIVAAWLMTQIIWNLIQGVQLYKKNQTCNWLNFCWSSGVAQLFCKILWLCGPCKLKMAISSVTSMMFVIGNLWLTLFVIKVKLRYKVILYFLILGMPNET